jgi:hypothetical protein
MIWALSLYALKMSACEWNGPGITAEVLMSQELMDGIETFIDEGHDELYVRRFRRCRTGTLD